MKPEGKIPNKGKNYRRLLIRNHSNEETENTLSGVERKRICQVRILYPMKLPIDYFRQIKTEVIYCQQACRKRNVKRWQILIQL